MVEKFSSWKIWQALSKPHEYQILCICCLIWAWTEWALDKVWLDIKDLPSESFSTPLILTWLASTALSLYQFSTDKD